MLWIPHFLCCGPSGHYRREAALRIEASFRVKANAQVYAPEGHQLSGPVGAALRSSPTLSAGIHRGIPAEVTVPNLLQFPNSPVLQSNRCSGGTCPSELGSRSLPRWCTSQQRGSGRSAS